MAALPWKQAFSERSDAAVSVVTQFALDAAPVIAFCHRLRAEGIRLPVHVGIAGPAKLQTLLKFAIAGGVGPSLRVLQRRARDVPRLLVPFEPPEILAALAAHMPRIRGAASRPCICSRRAGSARPQTGSRRSGWLRAFGPRGKGNDRNDAGAAGRRPQSLRGSRGPRRRKGLAQGGGRPGPARAASDPHGAGGGGRKRQVRAAAPVRLRQIKSGSAAMA